MARRQDVTFPGPGGRSQRASLSRPSASQGRAPALLVLHELLGLNDDIRRIADRFADWGYVALAPDYFDGDGPKPLCVLRAMAAVRRGEGPAFALLEHARAWLAARDDVDPARVGVVGFCMGGGFALLYAARAPLGVVGAFYGDVPADAGSLRGIAPVCGGFGGRDRIFGRGAERLATHLDALGVPHDLVTYPEAGHSYLSRHTGWVGRLGRLTPMHAAYDEGAAEDSWRRMRAFFGEHLAGGRAQPPR